MTDLPTSKSKPVKLSSKDYEELRRLLEVGRKRGHVHGVESTWKAFADDCVMQLNDAQQRIEELEALLDEWRNRALYITEVVKAGDPPEQLWNLINDIALA